MHPSTRRPALAAVVSLLAVTAVLTAAAGTGPAQVPVSASPPAAAPAIARMEEVIGEAVSAKTFMGSVLVARGQDVLLDRGYGFANVEWEIPNTPATKFRLGSITKQFTAAAVLLLEERGKLRTDERMAAYLPGLPAAWDRITVHNLLTHTSGIPNFTALASYKELQASPASLESIVGRVRGLPLDFPSGEEMRYSNSGYILLGAIIEKVSGEGYAGFLRKNIFEPIGMSDSGYDSTASIIPRRAAGYTREPDGLANARYLDMSIPHAAGALYSTTGDLLRWERALFGGKVLTAASLARMTAPFKNDYAYGLTVRTVNGRRVVSHDGGIDGFNTHMAFYPESAVVVIVLGNLNGPAPAKLGAALASIANGDPR